MLRSLVGSEMCIRDRTKAFDTVDHYILEQKLNNYGIRESALKWFTSYLRDRSHYVKIGSYTSEKVEATLGVPQGSILGPLLFIIYTNDFTNLLDSARVVQFADDTSIILSHKNPVNLTQKANDTLNLIYNWLNANKLCLNIEKSSFLIITNKKQPIFTDIGINGIPIHRVRKCKILGVLLDDQLKFTNHIQYVANKIARISYVLHQLNSFIPNRTLKTIYHALAYPHLNYASIVWRNAPSYANDQLFSIQKRMVRNIYAAEYLACLLYTSPSPRDS